MRKNTVYLCFILAITVFLVSCKGETGSAGATGPTGADGTVTSLFIDGIEPVGAYDAPDTELNQYNPDTNYGTVGDCRVGRSGTEVYRGILRFDVSSIVLSDVDITKAYLEITVKGSSTSSASITVSAYPLAEHFNEIEATWNDRMTGTGWTSSGANPSGGSMNTSPVYVDDSICCGNDEKIQIPLATNVIKGWISAPQVNYGILLKADNESVNDNVIQYYTAEATDPGNRPKLVVKYSLP